MTATENHLPGEDGVIDGVVVDASKPLPARVIQPVVTVATHRHTRRAGRHLGYIPLGIYILFRLAWEKNSTSRIDRAIAVAQATGSHADAQKWTELRERFVQGRHRRWMDRINLALSIVKALPYIVGCGAGALILAGICMAFAQGHVRDVAVPWLVASHIVTWSLLAVAAIVVPAALTALCVTPFILWHVGRKYSGTELAPGWARMAADPDADIAIDESTIARALQGLRIPQISEYLKNGLPLQFVTACRKEGRGTYCQVRLPVGVTADRIAARRADLASGLYRKAIETWPTTGSEAGVLNLWVADKGALAEGAGPYPLLDKGFTDVFKGVPFGRTLRGDPMLAPLMERNTIVGGMPGQGKSSAARVIMVGAALDYTAELRICIPDTNFDFQALKSRCSVFIMGSETERIEEIRDELLKLHAEVQERGALLVQHEVPAVTRELASAGIGLHPVFFLLEEAHVAITHPEYGKDISGLLVDIVRLGRKRGIHVIVSTQAPTKDSMPRDVTRNCSNGIAYAVGDHVANDALLGQGAYRGGHRATELVPGTDRGIAVVKGFTGERSDMVQSYFLDVDKDNDQVTPIIDRALKEIARRGKAVPGTGNRRPVEQRDLLTDADEVLREERVKLRDLIGMLRTLAPDWRPYRRLTATELRSMLEDAGAKTANLSGTIYADPAQVRRVLAQRGENGGVK
jgi:DNA segregation ATPase FtsK/SpoIIIE, S-DNA-T family